MGRLIDVNELHNAVMLNKSNWGIFATSIDQLVEGLVSQVQTADAISKADYENRLKNDLAVMILEIQTEILEIPRYRMTNNGICIYRSLEEYASDVNNVIQKAIDSLKESEE